MQTDHWVEAPLISVIVPVRNGAEFVHKCLTALFASEFGSFEVIVVDDGSSDGTAAIVREFPCLLIEAAAPGGPAAARNLGASHARGGVLFFLDADVLVQPDSLAIVAERMAADPGLAALFGSYRADTVPENFLSRYKNLVHHHTHQTSREDASTFCSGFGAIRREAFERLGGFNPACRFLEDVEVGYRMYGRSMRVRLCKELQLTHCKRYSLKSLVRSDVLGRAIPWTRLMLENRVFRSDLNTQWHNLLSGPVACLLPAAALIPPRPLVFSSLLILLLALNAGFLRLCYRRGGVAFLLSCCVMCWFTYVYSAAGLAAGVVAHLFNLPIARVSTEAASVPES